jgi:acyl carrier protein
MASRATSHSVFSEVTEIFRTVLGDPGLELTPRSNADDVPGWDSMTHITLIVEAECRFGVEFRTTEIEALHNVGELVLAIEAKRASAAA